MKDIIEEKLLLALFDCLFSVFNFTIMKYLLFLFLFFSLNLNITAQSGWSDPKRLTDTVTYNSNPVVLGKWIFYEKQADTNGPVKIYYRNMKDVADSLEHELFGDTTISYRNPTIFESGSGSNYQDFLLYESNESGYFDVYAMKIDMDSIGETGYPLLVSDSNKNSLNVSFDYNIAAWVSNQNIYKTNLIVQGDSLTIDSIVLVDMANCYDPVCAYGYVAYRKVENQESHIYHYSIYTSAIKPIDVSGDCHNLHVVKPERHSFPFDPDFSWEKDGALYYYHKDIYGDTVFLFPLTPYGDSILQPDMYHHFFPVNSYIEPSYITYVSNINGNKEVVIYWGDGFQVITHYNLSNNSLLNQKPALYDGWYDNQQSYLLDIWETKTPSGQGSFLSFSKTVLLYGAISENKQTLFSAEAFPNPFNRRVTFKYLPKSVKPVKIIIRAVNGETVFDTEIEHPAKGKNTLTWNPNEALSNGVYLVSFIQDGNIQTIKVVKK